MMKEKQLHILTRLAVWLLLCACLHSCHTTKKITRTQTTIADATQALQEIALQQPAINQLQVNKLILTLPINKQQTSVNCALYLKADSLISISIQPLMGIEVYRINLTPQQATVIDKLNKRFATLDAEQIPYGFSMQTLFATLQQLITNQLPLTTTQLQNLNALPFELTTHEQDIILTLNNGDDQQVIIADRLNKRIKQCLFQIDGQTLTIVYDQFKEVENILIPTQIDININIQSLNTGGQAELNNIRIEAAKPRQEINLSQYQAVKLQNILNL